MLCLTGALGACASAWLGQNPDSTTAPAAPGPSQGSSSQAAASASPATPLVEAPKALDAPSPAGLLHGPALNTELFRLRHAAQQRVLGRDAPPDILLYAAHEAQASFADAEPQAPLADAVTITSTSAALDATAPEDDAEPPASVGLGYFVPVEHEDALGHFHRALARLAAGEDEDGKVRILAYGASHTQADTYPGYLRAYLQSRFGDGGQGFVLLGRVNAWYRTLDTDVRHRALRVRHARYRPGVKDEPLGLLGAALVGHGSDAFGEIVTASDSPNTHFEAHYFEQPGGGDFSLYLDDQLIARVQTKAQAPAPARYSFQALPGRHTIRARLHGNGPVRLFGVIAETAGPGVVVDTLGIGGARMSANLTWDEPTWLEAVRQRSPDLVTFAYGTNEAAAQESLESYERELRAVLLRLRKAAPQVSCLLVGPFDLPAHFRDRLLEIIATQRRVSRELGCGFWDGQAFMGGPGSIRRWASAKPPLASNDYVHLTRLGYVYAGTALGDALLRAYDQDPSYWATLSVSVAPPATSSP